MNNSHENTLPLGRYRHYKGGEYDVVSVAQHSETRELLVVYRCLYDNGSWWVRPLNMFCETLVIDGEVSARFEFIGSIDDVD